MPKYSTYIQVAYKRIALNISVLKRCEHSLLAKASPADAVDTFGPLLLPMREFLCPLRSGAT